jgi:hypothetical protein
LPIKIKEHLLPKEPDACETLLDRRLMYDLAMSVREAMAVLIIFVFDIHLNDLLEYFLAISDTEGIAILEDRQKDPEREKTRRDMERKLSEKLPCSSPAEKARLDKFSL